MRVPPLALLVVACGPMLAGCSLVFTRQPRHPSPIPCSRRPLLAGAAALVVDAATTPHGCRECTECVGYAAAVGVASYGAMTAPFGPGRIPEDLLGEIEAGRGEVSSRKLPGATGSRLDAHAQHADERLAPGFLVAARAALPLPRRRWQAPLPDEAAAACLVVAGAHARRAPGQARHPRPATPGPRAALPRGVRSSRQAAQPSRPGTPPAAGGAPASRTGLG